MSHPSENTNSETVEQNSAPDQKVDTAQRQQTEMTGTGNAPETKTPVGDQAKFDESKSSVPPPSADEKRTESSKPPSDTKSATDQKLTTAELTTAKKKKTTNIGVDQEKKKLDAPNPNQNEKSKPSNATNPESPPGAEKEKSPAPTPNPPAPMLVPPAPTPTPPGPTPNPDQENPLDPMQFELKRISLNLAGVQKKSMTDLGMGVVEKTTPGGGLVLYVDAVSNAEESLAAKSGLIRGDYILCINRKRLNSLEQFDQEIQSQDGFRLTLCRRRTTPLDPATFQPPDSAGRRPGCNYLMCRLDPHCRANLGVSTLLIGGRLRVTFVEPNGAADASGIRPGDRLLKFESVIPKDRKHFDLLIQVIRGDLVDVLVERPFMQAQESGQIASFGVPEVPADIRDLLGHRAPIVVKNIRSRSLSQPSGTRGVLTAATASAPAPAPAPATPDSPKSGSGTPSPPGKKFQIKQTVSTRLRKKSPSSKKEPGEK